MLDPEIFVIALIIIGITAGVIFSLVEFIAKRFTRRH